MLLKVVAGGGCAIKGNIKVCSQVLGIIATHAVVLQDLLTHFNVYNCWS